jgi:hypothetical protein
MPSPPPPLPIWPVVVAAIVVLIVSIVILNKKHTTVVTPDENACDCPDLQNMLDRSRLAEEAIKSIDDQIAAQSAKDPQEMYSDELYTEGRTKNQARVSIESEGEDYTGSGETHHTNCKTDVSKGKTECIKASLQAHENVHQRECLKINKRFGNYKDSKKMVEFWQEDREGYQKEVEYLARQIPRVTRKVADGKCQVANYPGAQSKEEQGQRYAGSKRRATQYVAGLPALPS